MMRHRSASQNFGQGLGVSFNTAGTGTGTDTEGEGDGAGSVRSLRSGASGRSSARSSLSLREGRVSSGNGSGEPRSRRLEGSYGASRHRSRSGDRDRARAGVGAGAAAVAALSARASQVQAQAAAADSSRSGRAALGDAVAASASRSRRHRDGSSGRRGDSATAASAALPADVSALDDAIQREMQLLQAAAASPAESPSTPQRPAASGRRSPAASPPAQQSASSSSPAPHAHGGSGGAGASASAGAEGEDAAAEAGSELPGDPVPGMRALLRLVAQRQSAAVGGGMRAGLSPALFTALEAAFSAADGTGTGWIDDRAFTEALRRALPSLTHSEVAQAVDAMCLRGVPAIDYRDFCAALASLASGDGLVM